MSPREARAAGALAADVVTAGAILTLAHTPTVLPIKCCWAALRAEESGPAGGAVAGPILGATARPVVAAACVEAGGAPEPSWASL